MANQRREKGAVNEAVAPATIKHVCTLPHDDKATFAVGRARILRMETSFQLSSWPTIRKSTSFFFFFFFFFLFAELVSMRQQRPSSRFEESRRAGMSIVLLPRT